MKSEVELRRCCFLLTLVMVFIMSGTTYAAIAASPAPVPVVSGPPRNEIHVTLFETPCLLSGPQSVSKSTLQAIHSISPEQIPPPETKEQALRGLEKLNKTSGIPAELDIYRNRLKVRLEAQIAFFDGLSAAKRDKRATTLVQAVKPHLFARKLKEFETAAKKLGASWNAATVEEITSLYNNLIEPDPEEQFHRAIRTLDIRYTCSYGEPDETEE